MPEADAQDITVPEGSSTPRLRPRRWRSRIALGLGAVAVAWPGGKATLAGVLVICCFGLLGLEAGTPVFQASQLDERLDAQARQLWNGTALTQAYLRTHQQLSDWLQRSGSLDTETAARESYLLGNEAIRQLVFDPLLPQPLGRVIRHQRHRHPMRHPRPRGQHPHQIRPADRREIGLRREMEEKMRLRFPRMTRRRK